MGHSVRFLNRCNQKHRGRDADPRENRRAGMRLRGDFKKASFAFDPSKKGAPWWVSFNVANLLRQWREGKATA